MSCFREPIKKIITVKIETWAYKIEEDTEIGDLIIYITTEYLCKKSLTKYTLGTEDGKCLYDYDLKEKVNILAQNGCIQLIISSNFTKSYKLKLCEYILERESEYRDLLAMLNPCDYLI